MKIILDLCGGTGSWSKPYRDAGYDVRVITKPGDDVATYHPPEGVYGVLAAPPCTMFSMARTNAKLPRDLKGAMETVQHCLRIIKVTGWHTGAGWGSAIKNEIMRVLKPGGKVISFGWNTMGLGLKRGFEMTRILIVPHGGSKNDTLVTVEIKAILSPLT